MPQAVNVGVRRDGTPVHRVALSGFGLNVDIGTLGAAIHSVRLDGVGHDLTLGCDDIDLLEGDLSHFGTLIAPVVNRLAQGRAPMADGSVLVTEKNHLGRHTLHSGSGGTHLKTWAISALGTDFVELSLVLADGEAGFPGHRQVSARFSLQPPSTLRLEVTVVSDGASLWNAANHSYWNLDGSDTFAGHRLQIHADHLLATDADALVTGAIEAVEGTWADFRKARPIAPGEPALDHCFCLCHAQRALTPVLILTGQGGVSLEVATTDPGVQVYDSRGAARPGRRTHEGLAVECQFWPDAPNHPNFPSIDLPAFTQRRQITEWRFAKGNPNAA